MTATLKRTGKLAAEVVAATQLARLGLPALAALTLLAVLLLAAVCWVISNDERARRVAQILLARTGNASALASPVARSETYADKRKLRSRRLRRVNSGTDHPPRPTQ